MIHRYVQWMLEHRAFNIFILAVYYMLVVLPHKSFGTFLNTVVFKGITRDQYNQYVLIIAMTVLTVYAFLFFKNSAKLPEHHMLWSYLGLNVLLAAILIKYLFVINIEMVHFPQYALFAMLLFPIVGTYTGTLIWTTLAGIIDEAYQYFYLSPKDTIYYDMNDVVTNLVGAVFGLLLLRSLSAPIQSDFKWEKSSVKYGLGVLVVGILIACLSGVLSIYPSEEAPYQLLREWPKAFWSVVHPNVTYHVMRPLEGTVVTILLWVVFSRMGEGAPKLSSHDV